MSQRLLLFLASLCLPPACGGDGGPAPINPSSATATDLHGYWWNLENTTASGPSLRVHGFMPAENALRSIPYLGMQPTKPVSVFYQGPIGYELPIYQIATYGVANGFLEQTVTLDVGAVPGTMYRTQIFEIAPRGRMVLQSSNAAMGRREYKWSDRCFPAAANRTHTYRGNLMIPVDKRCPNPFANGASLAVDKDGAVHNITGVLGNAASAGCAPFPAYGYWNGGCDPVHVQIPGIRNATLRVDDATETVHYAYAALDDALHYRRVRKGESTWTEERIEDATDAVYEMRMHVTGEDVTLIVDRTGVSVDIYRRRNGTWAKTVARNMAGMPLTVRMADATFDAMGRAVLLSENPAGVGFERTPGSFELVPLPLEGFDAGQKGGIAVDSAGVVHAVWPRQNIGDNPSGMGGMVISDRSSYGRFDGTRWETRDLGAMIYPRLALDPRGVPVILAAEFKASAPRMYLTWVERDGTLPTRALTMEPDFAVTASLENINTVALAIGSDGTIAGTLDGEVISVITPREWPRNARTVKITFKGAGGGRVMSSDGRINCTSSCTVEAQAGDRFFVRAIPAEGSALKALPCRAALQGLFGGCHITVEDITRDTNEFVFDFVPRSISEVVHVGLLADSTDIQDFHANAGRMAFLARTISDSVDVGGRTLSVASRTDQYLVMRIAEGASATRLVAEGTAVQVRANGTTRVFHSLLSPTMFGGTSIGTAGSLVIAESVYDEAGQLTSARALQTLPAGSNVGGFAVDELGNAVMVITNGLSLGITPAETRAAVLYAPATGDAVLHAISTDPLPNVRSTMSGGRAAVSAGTGVWLVTSSGIGEVTRAGMVPVQTEVTAMGLGVLWGPSAGTSANVWVTYDASRAQLSMTSIPLLIAGVEFIDSRFGNTVAYGGVAATRRVISYASLIDGARAVNFDSPSGMLQMGRSFRDATGTWVHIKQIGTLDLETTPSDNRYRNVFVHFTALPPGPRPSM